MSGVGIFLMVWAEETLDMLSLIHHTAVTPHLDQRDEA